MSTAILAVTKATIAVDVTEAVISAASRPGTGRATPASASARDPRTTWPRRWLSCSKNSRRLSQSSVAALREIVGFARQEQSASATSSFEDTLTRRLGREDEEIRRLASRLEGQIQRGVGARCLHGRPGGTRVPAPDAVSRSISMGA